jgi:hypothetical protein
MKLVISEKQLKAIVSQLNKNQDLTEEGEGEGAPESGTSSDGEKKTGATKWESGVTRGPANQIAVTKWADSYKITRGRANPLGEQVLLGGIYPWTGKTPDQILDSIGWDYWGQWGLTIGSIAAAFFIPGAQGLGIAVALDLIAAADLYFRQKDSIGAGVSTALAFVPVIGDIAGIGKLSNETIKKLINKFGPLKTKKQVYTAVNSLPPKSVERYAIEKILSMGPDEIAKLINITAKTGIKTKDEAKFIVDSINKLYKEKKITEQGLKTLFNRLALTRFGFDVLVSGGVLYIGYKVKEKKAIEDFKKSGIEKRGSSEKPAKPEDFQ